MIRFNAILVSAVVIINIVNAEINDDFCNLPNQKHCIRLTRSGNCHAPQNKKILDKYCKEFCEKCGGAPDMTKPKGRSNFAAETQHDYDCADVPAVADLCPELAADGDCVHSELVQEDCRETCGLCVWDGLCLDRKADCPKLAADDQCKKNRTYMDDYCPKSCGKCEHNGLCLDHSRECHRLAENGNCSSNEARMTELCPLSCNKCNELCLDRMKICSELRGKGECQKNDSYMLSNCPAACGKCVGVCKDRSTKCFGLVEKNWCETNASHMSQFCPKSCGECGLGCEDLHYDCNMWVGKGACQKHKDIFVKNCPKSCKFCNKRPQSDYVYEIESLTPYSTGVWGDIEFCPCGTHVVGFSLKYLEAQGGSNTKTEDDSFITGIRMLCSNNNFITSRQYDKGRWNHEQTKWSKCPDSAHATGIQLVFGALHHFDVAATAGIKLLCSDTSSLQDYDVFVRGDWDVVPLVSQTCKIGYRLVGLKTEIDEKSEDNTGLNNVNIYCAPMPIVHNC